MSSVPLCLLLSLTVLGVALPEDEEEYTWPHGLVPLVQSEQTVRLSQPAFAGEPRGQLRGACGIECQRALPRPDTAHLEQLLSYETVYENGTRTLTRVSVRGPAAAAEEGDPPRNASLPRPRPRRRREVYGTDSRFTIADHRFSTSYPFSTTVRVSTGCSGVLVSPRHVLTAAHCIHDGKDYVKGAKRLRVGLLKLRSKTRGGRGRGRRKGRGRKGERKGEQEEMGESEGKVKEEGKGEKQGKGAPEVNGQLEKGEFEVNGQLEKGEFEVNGQLEKGEFEVNGQLEEKGELQVNEQLEKGEQRSKSKHQGRSSRRRGRKSRARRSLAEAKKPSFRWTRVKQTQIPEGWLKGPSGTAGVAVDYDYALLEMKRPHRQRFMDLGVVPSVRRLPAGRVHFSGFDDDRLGQLVYRFCSVTEESGDLLYQQCDSQPGAGGSGIYVRLKEPGERKWTRKVVGVFSGHHWVDVNGAQQDYNVGVRITPEKYAQICHWLHGNTEECHSA